MSTPLAYAINVDPIIGQKRQFPLRLCDCDVYRDRHGKNHCCPTFIQATFCTGMILGRIVSRLNSETGTCMELGPLGGTCCILSLPVSFFSPLGGLFFFTCASYHYRKAVISKYNVEEEQCCNYCCCLNTYIDCVHLNCNYPCSFFQLYMSIKEWEEEDVAAYVVAETQQSAFSQLQRPLNA